MHVVTDKILTELSEDVYSFQISFDGAVVQLPTTYSVLEQVGFVMEIKKLILGTVLLLLLQHMVNQIEATNS